MNPVFRGPISIRERRSPVILAAVHGDPDALAAVLSAARPQIFRWVFARIRDLDDAEDVTQLVLLRLYSRLSVFRGDSLLSSWLYRVTMNELSGFLRKKAREEAHSQRWSRREWGEATPPPEGEAIDHARAAEAVKELAMDLPPLQRASFQMVDVDGFRPCEAAEELGRTQTTIRSSLCRARQKIRELVEQCRRELVEDWLEPVGLDQAG
jgi:RNA polymerase sigma factor (sigma-70 family)